MIRLLHPGTLTKSQTILLDAVLAVLFGTAWFLLLHGPRSLTLTNVGWIYNRGGDLFEHQISWEFFSQEPWHFPVGRIESYGYPFGSNISYTDSIPLMALPAKLLSPLVKTPFQYVGVWELMCMVGQMLVGMWLLGEFTDSYPKRLLGASLLVMSPPMLFRVFYHDALAAHWILLAGIWFVFLGYRRRLWRGAWPVIFAAALLVQPYLLAMLLPLWAASLAIRFMADRRSRPLIAETLLVPSLLLIEGYCLGLFDVTLHVLEAQGFGFFSWNLNGFINPLDTSVILKPMAVGTQGQYEGYSYLGLGNVLLLPVGLALFFARDRARSQWRDMAPLMVAAVLLTLFALSNKAFLGEHALWQFALPTTGLVRRLSQVAALFRTSGRFIWPVFYCLVLFGIVSVIRNMRPATPLLLLILAVQLIDVRPLYSGSPAGASQVRPARQLRAEFWEAAAHNNRHLVTIPAGLDVAAADQPLLEPIALYARAHQLTLNTGYFARVNYAAIQAEAEGSWHDLRRQRADPHTLYVFIGPAWSTLAQTSLSGRAIVCQVDGYTVAMSMQNALVLSGVGEEPYCSGP